MKTGTGRPRGRRNTRPGREAIASYYELLRSAADAGDINAAAALIELHHITKQTQKETTPCN